MKTLHIMRGLPGSGKSTTARNLALALDAGAKIAAIYATDDYWYRPNGKYDFNYDLIVEAHKWNQLRVERTGEGRSSSSHRRRRCSQGLESYEASGSGL